MFEKLQTNAFQVCYTPHSLTLLQAQRKNSDIEGEMKEIKSRVSSYAHNEERTNK